MCAFMRRCVMRVRLMHAFVCVCPHSFVRSVHLLLSSFPAKMLNVMLEPSVALDTRGPVAALGGRGKGVRPRLPHRGTDICPQSPPSPMPPF